MPATGSYSVGKLARNLVGRLQAKQQGVGSDGSAVLRRVGSVGRLGRSLVIGLVRRHISATVIRFIAAADTGSSFFCGLPA